MPQRTPLYEQHLLQHGKMVDFAGWDMPLHYGSQLQEHHHVRQGWGVFDVSHMAQSDITGNDALPFLRHILANDVARLQDGQAQYGLLLNPAGGIIDDLITYRLNPEHYRVVSNAGTRNKVLPWLRQQANNWQVTVTERTDLAMLAVQGPKALACIAGILPTQAVTPVAALRPFTAWHNGDTLIGRTGYTGEDGVEVILPAHEAVTLWQELMAAGAAPIGLGARDTLRLEAGLNLYGNDMDETIDPMTTGVAWTVHWQPEERAFIGREAIEPLRQTPPPLHRVGVILQDKGVLRGHQHLFLGDEAVGELTSGGFSPTLERGIGLARVRRTVQPGMMLHVEIRERRLPVLAVKPVFVRFGQAVQH